MRTKFFKLTFTYRKTYLKQEILQFEILKQSTVEIFLVFESSLKILYELYRMETIAYSNLEQTMDLYKELQEQVLVKFLQLLVKKLVLYNNC